MAAGGLCEIWRHSAARSTTAITSRISVVSRAAPAMRDFSTSELISEREEKSNRPPTRRNSRISVASVCWRSIHAWSVAGARSAIRCLPRGDEAYPRRSSRRAWNSSTRAEEWVRADIPFMLQEWDSNEGKAPPSGKNRTEMVHPIESWGIRIFADVLGSQNPTLGVAKTRDTGGAPCRILIVIVLFECGLVAGGARYLGCGCGEFDDEQGAAFGLVAAGDLAAVVLHDAVDGAETEARAFADRLGGVEGIKNALRLADSGAGVGELKHDFVVVVLCRDFQLAAGVLQGIHGVFDDLDECLKKLVGVGNDAWEIWVDRKLDRDFSRRPARFEHLRGAAQQ